MHSQAHDALVGLHHQRINVDGVRGVALDGDREAAEADGPHEGGEPAQCHKRWIGSHGADAFNDNL